MILKEITLLNFKSFGNPKAPLKSKIENLDLLNLIFGHNSSGKSNILKFLNLLFSRKLIRETYLLEEENSSRVRSEVGSFHKGSIINEPFIFHKNKRDTKITFDVSIEILKDELQASGFTEHKSISDTYFKKNKTIIAKIEGRITSAGGNTSDIEITQVSLNNKVIYIDNGSSKEYFKGEKDLEGKSKIFEDFLGIFNNLVFFLDKDRYLVSEEENSKIKLLSPHDFKNWVHNLSLDSYNYSKYEAFVEFVRNYGSQIEVLKNFSPTFSKSDDREIDVLISNGSERLPIGSFGTGIQQFILILSLIFDTTSKIILVEELELNLSPVSQQALLQIFATLIKDGKINQVIFTSHSKTLASTPDIKVYEVTISDTGVSTVKDMQGKKSVFFKRDEKIENQMRSTLRRNKIPGPEWE